jgi:hypothetical protein
MKYLILLLLILNSYGKIEESQFPFPLYGKTWCSGLKNERKAMAKHIIPAANFVKIDPLLLMVGMSSEGAIYSGGDYTEEFKNKLEFQLPNYKIEDGKLMLRFIDFDGKESLDEADGNMVVLDTYYQDGWDTDGNDTFGYEYERMKSRGLFPNWFKVDKLENVHKYELLKGPDVALKNDSYLNEECARFPKSNVYKGNNISDYTNRGRISRQVGDWGQAWYKNPQAQVYANAASWKYAEIKFFKMVDDFIKKYPDNVDQLNRLKASSISKLERVFWTKAMYNGGQGAQAGTYQLLKRMLEGNDLASDKYLTSVPNVFKGKSPDRGLMVVYKNALDVTFAYDYALSKGCLSGLQSSPQKPMEEVTLIKPGMNKSYGELEPAQITQDIAEEDATPEKPKDKNGKECYVGTGTKLCDLWYQLFSDEGDA